MCLNPAASNLAGGKGLQGAVQNERLLRAAGSSNQGAIPGQKKKKKRQIGYCKVIFL